MAACKLALSAVLAQPVVSSIWTTGGRGKGACHGEAVQNEPAVTLSGATGITLRSDYAPNRGCIYRTSINAYNLNQVPRIEADVRTSGNGGQWFSLWLDPIQYVQPPRNSGEIDLIENLPSVATNFAGCKGAYCAQRSWGVAPNAVNHHITMNYNRASKRLEVYHCEYGSSTCPAQADAPFIQLDHFPPGSDPQYFLVADIWNAVPGQQFEFSVQNINFVGGDYPPLLHTNKTVDVSELDVVSDSSVVLV